MNKTQQLADNEFTEAAGGEALFDDEATVLAQPVVPLGATAPDAPEEMTVVAGAEAAPGAGVLAVARRPTVLALILASALAGAVIGGTALYLFQRGGTTAPPQPQTSAPAQPQQSAEAATTTATTTAPAPAEERQPAAQTSEQPATPAQPAPQDTQAAPPSDVQGPQREAAPAREHEGGGDLTDARGRGRGRGRGGDEEDERDATAEQAAERPRRRDGAIDTQAPIPDDASPASVRAARVEEALRRIEDNRRARRARRVGVIH